MFINAKHAGHGATFAASPTSTTPLLRPSHSDEGMFEDLNMANMMETLDKNRDNRITWDEFKDRFLTMLEPFTEDDTDAVVRSGTALP